MDRHELTRRLKQQAEQAGFALAGVTPAAAPPGAARLDQWLDAGYAGEMHYIADRRDAYDNPRHVLDRARSIVMLAMNYRTAEPMEPSAGEGRISRYAWGDADYHDVIRARLASLADWLREVEPAALVRGVVDTAPLLEREFAQLAGLGWIGKNTLLINRQVGSWFFLAALLTDIELEYDEPHGADHCGTCRACLDACPTGAFPQSYVLDASRCISYLTIELRTGVPEELRQGIGDWVFGCDVCQDVCPWNSRAPRTLETAFAPRRGSNPLALAELFDLDDAGYRARFRHTPLWRPKRRGMLRNAAIALGNRPTEAALPALLKGLGDDEPLVRASAAWALGRYRWPAARTALVGRLRYENDSEVRREIDAALLRLDESASELTIRPLTVAVDGDEN